MGQRLYQTVDPPAAYRVAAGGPGSPECCPTTPARGIHRCVQAVAAGAAPPCSQLHQGGGNHMKGQQLGQAPCWRCCTSCAGTRGAPSCPPEPPPTAQQVGAEQRTAASSPPCPQQCMACPFCASRVHSPLPPPAKGAAQGASPLPYNGFPQPTVPSTGCPASPKAGGCGCSGPLREPWGCGGYQLQSPSSLSPIRLSITDKKT